VLVLTLAVSAQNARSLIDQGDTLLANGHVQKALEKFDAAVAVSPTADSYAARANAWFDLERDKKFIEDVQEALRLDSLHPEANYQCARFALRAGDDTAAVRYATRALKQDAHGSVGPFARIVRGQALAGLGKNPQAISDLQSGLGNRLDDLPALKVLAHLYDITGDHQRSLAVLETLCMAAPDDIENWSNRGFELNTLERFSEALPVFDRALDMEKGEPIILSNKAYALLKLGKDAEAFEAVDRSLKAYDANAYALRTRGILYLRKGDRENACYDLTLCKALGDGPEVESLINQYCGGIGQEH
jgi:tetratricopeptide (TPR) repeat protein